MREQQFIDEQSTAQVLGLSVKTLRQWRWRRVGPPWYKLGGAVRYDDRELAEWLANQRVETRHDERPNDG